jgi:hypothetical protein
LGLGKLRFKGSSAGNFDFDEMDATRFTNGHTFAGGGGSNSELRLKSQAWQPTLESPKLRECSARGTARNSRRPFVPLCSKVAQAATAEESQKWNGKTDPSQIGFPGGIVSQS